MSELAVISALFTDCLLPTICRASPPQVLVVLVNATAGNVPHIRPYFCLAHSSLHLCFQLLIYYLVEPHEAYAVGDILICILIRCYACTLFSLHLDRFHRPSKTGQAFVQRKGTREESAQHGYILLYFTFFVHICHVLRPQSRQRNLQLNLSSLDDSRCAPIKALLTTALGLHSPSLCNSLEGFSTRPLTESK